MHIDDNNDKFWTILLYLGLLFFNWKFDSILLNFWKFSRLEYVSYFAI